MNVQEHSASGRWVFVCTSWPTLSPHFAPGGVLCPLSVCQALRAFTSFEALSVNVIIVQDQL